MTYSESDVDAAFEQAPELVQDALSGGSATDFIVAAQTRYGLHIDTVGQLSHMVRDMLVGLLLPAEFYDGLIDLRIEPATAQRILTDVNAEVFVPLRLEMQKQGITQTMPVRTPTPPQVREPLVPVPSPVPETAFPQPVPQTPSPAPVPTQPVPQTFSAPQQPAQYDQTQWPGHPGANWQPAAAVHVYVPAGGYVSTQPGMNPPQTYSAPQPVPVQEPIIQAPVSAYPQPTPVVATPVPTYTPTAPEATPPQQVPMPTPARPLPPPPMNLPGTTPPTPLEKIRSNDPYREPV